MAQQHNPTKSLFTVILLAACLLAVAVPVCSALVQGSSPVGSADRTWSFDVDTSTFKPDEYIVSAAAVQESVTGNQLFNVLERSSSASAARPSPATTAPPAGGSGGYYITIDPIGDRFVGDRFTITGHTNLPAGAEMLVQVYSSSFKPTQKSQSGEFSGATGTVRAGGAGSGTGLLAPGSTGTSAAGPDTKIIRTGSVTLQVPDVPGAAGRLHELAIGEGGYVSSSTIQAGGSRHSGTVILRIPAAHFDAAMAGISGAGTVLFVTTKGEDVTEEYLDLGARKKAYEAQLEQYYALLKKAGSMAEILAIQQRIDQVQTQLDQVNGRIRYLDSRIDLATITITLQEPEPIHTDTGHNFAAAFNRGIETLYGLVDASIITVIALFPLILIAGAGLFWYRRKMNRPALPAPCGPTEQHGSGGENP